MSGTDETVNRKGACLAQERLKRLQGLLSEERGRKKAKLGSPRVRNTISNKLKPQPYVPALKRNTSLNASSPCIPRCSSQSESISKTAIPRSSGQPESISKLARPRYSGRPESISKPSITRSSGRQESISKPSAFVENSSSSEKISVYRLRKSCKLDKGPSQTISSSNDSRRNFYKRRISSVQSHGPQCTSVDSTKMSRSVPNGNIQGRVKELLETAFRHSNTKVVERKKVEEDREPDLHKVRCLAEEKQVIETMDVDLCTSSNTFMDRRVSGLMDEQETNVHFVVDTNVLIDSTGSLKLLKSTKVKSMTPILIVPWQVLKELDYLKEDKTSKLAIRARTAVNFVMSGLTSGDSFIRGQPQEVADRSDGLTFKVEVPDDHLIKCSLQLMRSGRVAVLLTNDKNLIAKAYVSGAVAISNAGLVDIIASGKKKTSFHPFETPPEKCSEFNDVSNNINRLTQIFAEFLNEILRKVLMSEFGPMWPWHTPPEARPWGLITLIGKIKSCVPHISRQLEAINRFYTRWTSYSHITMAEVSVISHMIFQLVAPLSTEFENETVKLNSSMAFLKCPNPLGPQPGSTFIQESIQLANLHFAAFDRHLRSFCHWMSINFQVPFPLAVEEPVESTQFDPSQLDLQLSASQRILQALESLQTVPLDEIDAQTWAIQEITSQLRSYPNDSTYEQFQADDVVRFFKNSDLRGALSNAISILTTIVLFLNHFKR